VRSVAERVDANGVAYAGSQLQTQLYVNQRASELGAAIRVEFPELTDATIQWRSPLASESYAEYWDRAFLDNGGLSQHAAELKAFWPSGGPHWDALAAVTVPGSNRPGVLLAEGKSYPGELYGSGCQAKPGSQSRALIENSLANTQRTLGVTDRTPADWCGPLYQSANRLAHQQWLRTRGVRVWLVHLLFVDDPIKPTSAKEWEAAMAAADEELGVADKSVDGAGHVLLPARTRTDIAP
jgi:hypothetical protein